MRRVLLLILLLASEGRAEFVPDIDNASLMHSKVPMGQHFPQLATMVGARRYGDYVTAFEARTNMGEAGLKTLSQYCSSLYWSGKLGRHRICTEKLGERLASPPQPAGLFGGANVPYHMIVFDLLSQRLWAHLALGEFEAAVEDGLVLRDLLERYNRPFSWMISELGVAQALSGDADAARETIARIRVNRQHASALVRRVAASDLDDAVIRVLMALGDYEGVLREIENAGGPSLGAIRAISVLSPGDLAVEYARSFQFARDFAFAKASFETGQVEAAEATYKRLTQDRLAIHNPNLMVTVHHDLGRAARDRGEPEAAIDAFARAIDQIEALRSSYRTETARIGFVGDKQAVYRDMVETLVGLGRSDEALAYAERAKARALVDLLSTQDRFGTPAEGDAAAAWETVRQLGDELAGNDPAQPVEERRRSLLAYNEALTKLGQQAPGLRTLVSVDTLSVQAIRERLMPGEGVLEFFGDDRSTLWAFLVDQQGTSVHAIDAQKLRDDVEEFRERIEWMDDWHEAAKRLYARLISPFEDRLDAFERLTIVPHGILHYLPFPALEGEAGLLVDRLPLRVLPSASVLALLTADHAGGEALILGNPDLGDPALDLPGAEAEARAVAALFGPKAELHLRSEATETRVKRGLAKGAYLHLASHGEFDARQPMTSRMLLAPDAENDGRLTVAEIYDLRLDARLVTLSACDTGLGEVAGGNDVIGLTRGLLHAGANGVVASLWPVPDEPTRYLMTRFYEAIDAGADAAEALMIAQQATRGRFPHPNEWAAFRLTGSP